MTSIIDDIFIIERVTHENSVIEAVLNINSNSRIFEGHFPGQPVVPGACILLIVKDVLESALSLSLRLRKAGQLKFIKMIDPLKDSHAQLTLNYKLIEDGTIVIKAELVVRESICFKMQGLFAIG